MSIELKKYQLKEKGYCSFNLKDFDESGFNYIKKYKCNSESSLRKLMKNLRADYKNPYEKDTSENINKQFDSFEEAEMAKWKILNNTEINKADFFQIWLYNNINDKEVQKIYDKITKYFFDLEDTEELQIELSVSLYNRGCFLQDHIDGKSPVKNYASILIYLNENYDTNNGGNLILGSLDYKRDWSYAKDIVDAMYLINQNPKSKTYVIGSGKSNSVEKLVEIVFQEFNLNYKNYIKVDENLLRKGDPIEICSDPSKLQRDYNWDTKYDFENFVKRILNYKVKNL